MLIKTLSVAVQTARAIIARDRLTLDTAPFIPFINGLLPVPPPVRLTLPIVHVRYDALTPPPLLHIYPLSRTFLLSPQRHPQNPYHRGQLPCPSGNVISAFSYVNFLTYADFFKINEIESSVNTYKITLIDRHYHHHHFHLRNSHHHH